MVEYLWSFMQGVCAVGYLYGAWLVIEQLVIVGAEPAGDDHAVWHRYLAYDM